MESLLDSSLQPDVFMPHSPKDGPTSIKETTCSNLASYLSLAVLMELLQTDCVACLPKFLSYGSARCNPMQPLISVRTSQRGHIHLGQAPPSLT